MKSWKRLWEKQSGVVAGKPAASAAFAEVSSAKGIFFAVTDVTFRRQGDSFMFYESTCCFVSLFQAENSDGAAAQPEMKQVQQAEQQLQDDPHQEEEEEPEPEGTARRRLFAEILSSQKKCSLLLELLSAGQKAEFLFINQVAALLIEQERLSQADLLTQVRRIIETHVEDKGVLVLGHSMLCLSRGITPATVHLPNELTTDNLCFQSDSRCFTLVTCCQFLSVAFQKCSTLSWLRRSCILNITMESSE